MQDEFYQDEFYLECPDCGGELKKMDYHAMYCYECGWFGSQWEAN